MRIEYLYVVKWHFMNNYRLIVCRDAADIGTASRRQHRATEPAPRLPGHWQWQEWDERQDTTWQTHPSAQTISVYLWSSSHSDCNVKCKKLYYWWGCSYYNVQWCKEGDGVITLYFSLCNVANWIKINGSLNKRCTGVCYSMIPGRAPLVDILLSFKTYF